MLNDRQKLNSREEKIISEFANEWIHAADNFVELQLISLNEERVRTHLLMERLKSIYPNLKFAIEYSRREDKPGIYSQERDYVIIQAWKDKNSSSPKSLSDSAQKLS